MPKLSIRIPSPDCSQCPCAWEDMSYEGECSDCGCVLHRGGSMPESGFLCRLPDRIKRMLRRLADQRQDAMRCSEAEDMAEWFDKENKKDRAMEAAVTAVFPDLPADPAAAAELRIHYEQALEAVLSGGKGA